MSARLDVIKARTAKLTAEIDEKALTPEEQEEASALAEEREKVEALATIEATRRANDGASRLESARARVAPDVLLGVVDLVSYFPLGSPPPAGKLPNGGVIIVRNPPDGVESMLLVELEHKNAPNARKVDELLIDVLLKSVVDPDPSAPDAGGAEGAKLQGFCRTYRAAACQAAGVARRLGGAKATEAKRGRE